MLALVPFWVIAMNENNYWRTDLATNLIDDLTQAEWQSSTVLNSDRGWKWFVFAIHCATQSACVCALRGAHSSLLSILDEHSQKRYRKIISGQSTDSKKIELRLALFTQLYKRTIDPSVLPSPFTAPEYLNDMEILNTTLRNPLQHFSNDSLSVEISGLPRISQSACRIIEHLAVTHRTMNFRLSDEQHQVIDVALRTIRANLVAIEHRFALSSNA